LELFSAALVCDDSIFATDLRDANLKTNSPPIVWDWDLHCFAVIEHPSAFGHAQANIKWRYSRYPDYLTSWEITPKQLDALAIVHYDLTSAF
jgi:hypothetical protein